MFGKKQIRIKNRYDMQFESINNRLIAEYRALTDMVKLIILKNQVIELYPDGPDHDTAIEDANKAKKALINYLASYDVITHEAKNFHSFDKMEYYSAYQFAAPINSHAAVEKIYQQVSH